MKKMMTIIALVSFIVISFTNCNNTEATQSNEAKIFATVDEMVADAKTRVQELTVQELNTILEGEEPFILLDVRTVSEHNGAYIPGSISMPRGVVEFRIASEPVWDNEGMYPPAKDELLLIYCKKGSRGALTADALQRMGFTNVKNVTGGFLEWKANFPEKIEVNEAAAGFTGAAAQEEDSGGC